MDEKNLKQEQSLPNEEFEQLQLLQKAHETTGRQLAIDPKRGDLTEINEVREALAKIDNPEQKYDTYYKGVQKILLDYLPKGKMYQQGRQLIFDEKNIFLTGGKRKSDNNGKRGGDGRMTYQADMNEILDLIIQWVSTSQKPIDLYNMLYRLNDKHNYKHEEYDKTAISYSKALDKIKNQ